jgi:hypothetical protein
MAKVYEVLNKCMIENSPAENGLKYEAAANIKALLDKLDLNVEVVPENNHNMLTSLISSLKGTSLTTQEKEIIQEITGFRVEGNENEF